MKLKITKSDIRNGKQHDPSNCAVARSIKRQYRAKHQKKELMDVNVLPGHVCIHVFENNKVVSYGAKMPVKGTSFVEQFDNDMTVKPMSLDIPLKRTGMFKACAI
jgi:hypothetical protein